jgi:uncharacterized protein (DUF2336 family)
MSYCFRDLEAAGDDKRKSAILLALIAGLDDLRVPNPNETRKFGELFIPLFNAVPADIQRRAAASLSRCPYVPASVSEFISLQPLEISAPYLSHSPSLTSPILCYVIAKTDEAYAKIIAKRHDLNKRTIQALLAVDAPAVTRALQLRGYIGDAAIHLIDEQVRKDFTHKVGREEPGSTANYGEVEFFGELANEAPQSFAKDEEKAMKLMERVMAEGIRLNAGDVEMFEPLETDKLDDFDRKGENWQELWQSDARHIDVASTQPRLKVNYTDPKFDPNAEADRKTSERVGKVSEQIGQVSEQIEKAARHVGNVVIPTVKTVHDKDAITEPQFAAEEHLRQTLRNLVQGDLTSQEAAVLEKQKVKADPLLSVIVMPIHEGEIAHRHHIAVMEKHVRNNRLEYFTTALADALGSSIELSERIMSDMSGIQLAITFSAILAPQDLCINALNKFFPHVSAMEGTSHGAEDMLERLQHGTSVNRIMTWLKADVMTREREIADHQDGQDIDCSRIEIGDLPYVAPVGDNNDRAPVWPEQTVSQDDHNWLEAISK